MTTNTNTGTPTTYNGWTNYQTWRVNLGLDTDHYTERAREITEDAMQDGAIDASEIRKAVRDTLAYEIRRELWDYMPQPADRIYYDLLADTLNAVNYEEIARHYAERLTFWVAGWNMPGYMPDTDTAIFISEEDARAYIVEELERATEGEDDTENMDAIAEAMDAMREGEGQTVTYAGYVYWVHSA